MPLMIARPCALHPTVITRLQYPCQAPLLRRQPLVVAHFTSCSIVRRRISCCSLLAAAALAHDANRALLILFLLLAIHHLPIRITRLIWPILPWLMISKRTLVQNCPGMVKSSVLAHWVCTGLWMLLVIAITTSGK